MSARKKLNTIYLFAATGIAAIFGLLFRSVVVFAICLALLIAAFLDDGSIRPKSRRRRR